MNKIQTDVLSAWYIRSFAGDYNPVHTHTGSQLTCVGFLKVPDFSNEIRKVAEGPSGRYRRPGQNGILEIKIASKEKVDSYLQLDFSLNPFQLRRWVIIDQIGTEIVVTLQNHRFDVELPASTFRGMPINIE